MRIIFVGLHNKPDMMPLDMATKTGKIVNKIIAKLPKDIEIVKSNLFDVDYMPLKSNEIEELTLQWYWANLPIDEDVIVLFGWMTQRHFYDILRLKIENLKIIKAAHPAAQRSSEKQDEYIRNISGKIKKYIKT